MEGSNARDGMAAVPLGVSGPGYGAKGGGKTRPAHSKWSVLRVQGEYFRAFVIDRPRWANSVRPMLLSAPQHVTVSTNAGTSGRLYETHDAFARCNSTKSRCIWLAMVSSVSPETVHTPAKVLTVSRKSPATSLGGGGA